MLGMSIGATMLFGLETIINPYSRYTGTMPGITGTFFRSLFITAILVTYWIYKYGWFKATILTYSYYGLFYLMFTLMFYLSYGDNPILGFFASGYSGISITIRGLIQLSSPFVIWYYKIYRFSYTSIISLTAYIGYSLAMIYVFPLSWMSGEGNIPLQVIPQMIEFGSIILSVNSAYQFLRWSK